MSSEGVWENLRLMRYFGRGLKSCQTPGKSLSDCRLIKHCLINSIGAIVSESSLKASRRRCPSESLNHQNFANTIGKPIRSAATRQYYIQIYQAMKYLSLDVTDFIEKGPQMAALVCV